MEKVVMAQTVPQNTSLAALRKSDAMSAPAEMRAGFDTVGGFELMQRGARLLSSSTIVPASYRSMVEKKVGGGVQMVENPSAMSNCVVALNMAQRMGADPLMIMQNLYIVEGRPAWSSQYIIASINACGKYSPLRFSIEDLGEKDVEYVHYKWEGQYPNRRRVENTVKSRIQDRRCIAWAVEKATGERLESPPVTIEMSVKEGWFGKEGSKWQTMPEVMLRYRAASFFGKLYAPELLMGIQSAEEVHDSTYTVVLDDSGIYQMPTAEIRNTETGEVTEQPEPQPAPQEQHTAPASKATPAAEKKPQGKAAPGTAEKTDPAPAPAREAQASPAAAEPDEVGPGQDPFPPMTVHCPKSERQVDELDCAACSSRNGCPAFD